jgi:hypothetical protein
MESPDQVHGTPKNQVVLEMHPGPGGFLPRYLLALTPLFLLVISLLATAAIRGMVAGLPMSIPTPMGTLARGMGDMVETLILLTAPVGIYTLFIGIGWMMKYVEMWTGSLMALGLGILGGLLLVITSSDPSMRNLEDLLFWLKLMAFLMPYASATSIIIVMGWVEMFRRSLRYTITYEDTIAKGGIWKQQERVFPHHQIGKLVMEQGMLGRLLDTGTIIPIGAAQGGSGPAGTRQEISCDPLDSLYGVREPEKIMTVLNLLISDSTGRVERQAPSKEKASGKA